LHADHNIAACVIYPIELINPLLVEGGGASGAPPMVFPEKKIFGAELVYLLLVVPSQLFSASFGILLTILALPYPPKIQVGP